MGVTIIKLTKILYDDYILSDDVHEADADLSFSVASPASLVSSLQEVTCLF